MDVRDSSDDESGSSSGDDGPEVSDVLMLLVAVAAVHRQRRRRAKVMALASGASMILDDESEDSDDEGRGRKGPRTVYSRPPYEESAWAKMLRDLEAAESPSRARDVIVFRRRFRVPYQFFKQLVELVKEREWFPSRTRDVAGRACIPVELKVRLLNLQDDFHRLCEAGCVFSTLFWTTLQ